MVPDLHLHGLHLKTLLLKLNVLVVVQLAQLLDPGKQDRIQNIQLSCLSRATHLLLSSLISAVLSTQGTGVFLAVEARLELSF